MKRWTKIFLCAQILGLLAACQTPVEPEWPFTTSDQMPEGWETKARYRAEGEEQTAEVVSAAPADELPPPEARELPERQPLYAWDGGVIDGPASGVSEQEAPKHGIEPSIEGRMHIIELYQEVLDERDALLQEVTSLSATLDDAQTRLKATREKVLALETRIEGLEAGRRTMSEENQQMASRLTTAQIRRLEAEKLLLESRIAWHRERLTETGGSFRPGGGE